jgi:hypothetical protein
MLRSALVVLASAIAGCAPSAPAAPVAPLAAPDDVGRPTTLSLERAESFEVLAVAQSLVDESVYVEAVALAPLRCMTVTVKEASPLPRRDAAAKLFDALRAQGLRVAHTTSGWTVGIDEAHPPQACAPMGRATAASEASAKDPNDPATAEDPEAKSKAIVDEVLRSIREISPTEHAIGRHALELFLQNQDLLMRQARIVPEIGTTVPGKPASPTALRIFGVRPDSVLGRVGLQNGDRIERVMGKSVATPEQALEAYAAMRNAKTIDIDVTRGGTSKKLLIHVE